MLKPKVSRQREKALTAETYTDRCSAWTETRTVPATGVPFFTGNNIGPRGDLASLLVGPSVRRPVGPEEPLFKHPDLLGWTEANRGRIPARNLYNPTR